MSRYFLFRILAILPLALLITFVAFSLMSLAPSDPAEVALRLNEIVPTPEAIALTRTELGLDQPFLVRYFNWLYQVTHLDFGHSFLTRMPVLDELLNALPATLYLAAVTLVLIVVLSLTLALLCLWNRQGWLDKIIRSFVFVLTAVPNYWLGLLLIWLLAVRLGWFPVSGMTQSHSVFLPALTLSMGYIGTYVRLIRGTMLSQLNQPYVFYARARGFSKKQILFRHVLPNSLQTSLIAMGMSIPKLIAGTVVIESIFAWPGVGRLCIHAIFGRDYPMIQAYILMMALLFLGFNLLADLLQRRLNPRLFQS